MASLLARKRDGTSRLGIERHNARRSVHARRLAWVGNGWPSRSFCASARTSSTSNRVARTPGILIGVNQPRLTKITTIDSEIAYAAATSRERSRSGDICTSGTDNGSIMPLEDDV